VPIDNQVEIVPRQGGTTLQANLKRYRAEARALGALITTRTTTHEYDLYDPKRRGR
jgi:hypothetical protein